MKQSIKMYKEEKQTQEIKSWRGIATTLILGLAMIFFPADGDKPSINISYNSGDTVNNVNKPDVKIEDEDDSNQAIIKILGLEGGYVDHKNDSGGKTRFGITIATARANGYSGEMKDLPVDFAIWVYKEQYWNKMKLNEVNKISPKIADRVMDTGVNMGNDRSIKMLQRTLNVLTKGQAIAVDGSMGKSTLRLLNRLTLGGNRNQEPEILKILNSLKCVKYVTLAEKYPKNKSFIYGWVKNRIK